MTVYFQGSEGENFNAVGSNDTSGDHDTVWSRQALNGSKRAYTGAAITDFWVRTNARNTTTILGNNHVWATIYDLAGTARIRWRGTSNNVWAIEYWNGSSWVATGCSGTGIWNTQVEIVCHIDITTGTVETWNNGTLQGSVTGVPLSTYFADLSSVLFSQPTGNFYVSQVIIADESLLLWNLASAWPIANGTDTDGVGDYTNVDENGVSDTDYNSFTAAGEKRSYTLSTTNRNNISRYAKAVTAACRAMRLDNTGPQQIRPYLLIGGTRYYGTTFMLTTGWDAYHYTWRDNPATGLAWEIAEVEDTALEVGWEAVA